MSYSDQRTVFSYFLRTQDMAAGLSDNDDIFHILVPPNKEVEIQNFIGYCALASDTGTDSIELVKEDDTVLCQLVIGATGKLTAKTAASQAVDQTFPIRVAPQSTSAWSLLKLKANGATDATTTVSMQVHISGFSSI